ncbi:hypothetical protein DFH06DRAFT_1351890 [Mycena polygramma]|nr:hypothetical protein DFH06DRAFT_1351890 [Mycena polygramma]
MAPRNYNVQLDDEVRDNAFVAHSGVHLSNDGRRVVTEAVEIRQQKKARHKPTTLDDQYAEWTPMDDAEGSDLHAFADTVSSFDISPDDDDGAKRKRYLSSDEPMRNWRPLAQEFMDARVRRAGLGDYLYAPACTCCGQAAGPGIRLFRCMQCGEFLQCGQCVKSRHSLTPLHCIWEWNGDFWTEATMWGSETTPNAAGLKGLGLVYQLGHHGFPCEFPGARHSMVVIHVNGIHTVEFDFCACDKSRQTNNLGQLLGNAWYPATTIDPGTCATFECLEAFRLLNVVGNLTVSDYVGTLERLTDPLHLSTVPDRYKAFSRMARQYSYVQRAQRAGCAHNPDGLEATEDGGLAVPCWTCPQEGKNLPDGWRDVDPKYRFLYMLILAMDANFRLKNRLRANEHQDPSLAPGKGYFCTPAPYKEHLKHYVAEKDVSSCIAFAALLQKETRLTTGLRVSGVGGCVCARHGVVRPHGLGDLQKGERYANMDWIFLAAIAGIALLCLAISYDIACQWQIHLKERAKKIAEKNPTITTNLDDFEIQYALPVWHAVAHETSCQTQNSLSYAVGVGRTDGEGIERTWSILNPLGFATKEMGDGARHDAIENKVDHINYEKNVRQGSTLARKLIVAIAERDKQVAEFKEVDKTLDKKLRGDWKERVEQWQKDKSKPNPYCLEGGKSAGPSEAAVMRELKEAEALDAAEGRAPLTEGRSTASAFIKAGLQLEESQRRIRAEVKGVTLVTADRSSQIQELRLSFHKKLRTFERLQGVYMPGVAALRADAEERRDPDLPPPKAEDIKLWLPSDLSAAERRSACARGVAESEAKLRHGQCVDALENVRSRLHTQKHLITWRNSNSVGQRAATRSASLIGRVGDRLARVAEKYRRARVALIALKGEGFAPHFKELKPGDMNVNAEEESDTLSRKKLGRLGSRKHTRIEPTHASKTFSWIWTVGGGPGEDEGQLHESVRVEWSKARARRDRWVEEVELLREESKRVLRFLRWVQKEWEGRAERRTGVDPKLAAGLKAYALRQMAVHRRIGEGFFTGWNVSAATAVGNVVRQDGTVYRDLLDGQDMDAAPGGGMGIADLEEEEMVQTEPQRSTRQTTRAG